MSGGLDRWVIRKKGPSSSTREWVNNLDDLPSDPALRDPISHFHPDQQDKIRRHYLVKGPCQPRGHNFPQTCFGVEARRFNEVSSDLLICMSCLSPCDNFRAFDIPNIVRFSDMYPYDFNEDDKRKLKVELSIYIDNLKEDARFGKLKGLSSLVQLMVETKKHLSFILVYRLLKLALVLPVATSTVERCFSAMKFVKSDLRNRIGDENLSDSCICYIEKDLLQNVCLEDVMARFQQMKTRREQL